MSIDYMGMDDAQAMEHIQTMIEREPGEGRDAFHVLYDIKVWLAANNVKGTPLQRLQAAYRAIIN